MATSGRGIETWGFVAPEEGVLLLFSPVARAGNTPGAKMIASAISESKGNFVLESKGSLSMRDITKARSGMSKCLIIHQPFPFDKMAKNHQLFLVNRPTIEHYYQSSF
jgi:hypothetical protein